jgi:hypothetical protein
MLKKIITYNNKFLVGGGEVKNTYDIIKKLVKLDTTDISKIYDNQQSEEKTKQKQTQNKKGMEKKLKREILKNLKDDIDLLDYKKNNYKQTIIDVFIKMYKDITRFGGSGVINFYYKLFNRQYNDTGKEINEFHVDVKNLITGLKNIELYKNNADLTELETVLEKYEKLEGEHREKKNKYDSEYKNYIK